MTQEGYVKFHRQYLESDLWLSEPFTKGQAWVDLFGLANYKEHTIWIRGVEILVKRGELARSELTLAKRWRWSREKVRRFLSWLESDGKIRQQKSNVTSLIYIINYDRYNSNETPNQTAEKHQTRQQKNTKPDSKRDTNKKEKKEKKDKNKEIPETSPKEVSLPSCLSLKKEIPAEISTFVEKYMQHITATKGNLAPKTPSLKNKSEETIEKLVRLDKFQLDYIREVLRWASKDDFWRDKILSLASLRKASAKNDLTKFQNIAHGYEASKQPEKGREAVIIASPAQTTEQLEATIERFFQ